MDSLKGALLSKLVWLGVGEIVWGLAQVYLGGGVLTTESLTAAALGVITIIFRAVTDRPLADKTSLL